MFTREIKLPEKHSFFLFGARGTGKTTLLKSRFVDSESLFLNLLDPELYQELSLNPGNLKALIASKEYRRVIIDEVQKIPTLLDVVHDLIEKKKGIQFVLTGSSACKLKRGAANLLAGRAFSFGLYPLTVSELGELFDLQHSLAWGTLLLRHQGS